MGVEILSDKSHYEEFICAICVEIVDLNQNMLTHCSHIFCQPCLQKWLERKKTCPTCQLDLAYATTSQLPPLKIASPLAWRVLSRIRVKCPLTCSWQGDYSELHPHLMNHEQNNETEVGARETALILKEQGNEKYSNQNYTEAIKLYTKAIAMDDGIAAIYSNRCAVFLVLGEYHKALSDAKKAVQLDEGFAKAYTRGSKALIGLGKFGEALEFLHKCPAKEENKKLLVQIEKMTVLFETARKSIKESSFSKARQSTTALLAHTNATPVLLLAARAECEVGSCERALKLTLQVLRAEPNNPDAYCVRALAIYYAGDVEEAMKYVKQAVRIAPDDKDAVALFKRIKLFGQKSKDVKDLVSKREYMKAVERMDDLVKNEKFPQRALVKASLFADRANSLFRLKRFSDALEDCKKAIAIKGDCKRAWLTRFYVLHETGKHEQALEELTAIVNNWGGNDSVLRGAHEKAQFEVRKAKRPDYYALLTPADATRKLSSISSEMEIKSAYKKVCLETHPDRLGPSATEEERKVAEEQFKLVGEAFEILTSPFKRKLYDDGFDKEVIEERLRRAERGGHHRQH